MRDFKKKISQFIKQEKLLNKGDRVLVACSGGVDSMGLLHFLATNRHELKVEVAAVHVDHMLRGAESALDGEFVKEACESYGIPFFGGSVPVPSLLSEAGGNMQNVCRERRYAYFTEVLTKAGYNVLAIAHHAEDQLETVLMQVTKGVRTLGMPIHRAINGGRLIRPFLPVMKNEIQGYLKENDLNHREDPSNLNDSYMRNRFRHHIVPFVLDENSGAARNSVKLTKWLQEDEDLLSTLTLQQFDENVEISSEGFLSIEVALFLCMHPALQRRLITLVLKYLYDGETVLVEYNSTLIETLFHQLLITDGTVSIDLPLGYKFVREYGKMTFAKNVHPQRSAKQFVLPKDEWISCGTDLMLYWTEKNNLTAGPFLDKDEVFYFSLPDSSLPLGIRRRQEGDRMLLAGMGQAKRLSRLFIDEKVAVRERDSLPVLVTADGEVCAVPGLRYGKVFTKSDMVQNKYIFCVRKL